MRKTTRDRHKAATRNHIAEVARRLFLAEGYDTVTVERIAAESEVSDRTVMRHFETKEHLALAEFYDLIDDFRATVRKRDRDESVPAFFRGFLTKQIQADPDERAKSALRFFEFVETSTALYGQFLHFLHQLEQVVVIALAEEAGCDEPTLGHRILGASLVFAVLAVSRHAIATGEVGDYPRQLSAALDFVNEKLADYDPPAARRSSRRSGRRAKPA